MKFYHPYIIRKTKRSEKTKRSDVFRKTKCSFFDFPTRNLKRLRRLWGVLSFLIIKISHIQVELDVLLTAKQHPCAFQIILVYVYISEIQCDVLQWQVYLPRHKIKVVYIGR